jgi:hypothetical protein
MVFDERLLKQSLEFDSQQVDELRRRWGQLMDVAVWGDIQLSKIGALPRLRKRVLEVGEGLSSLFANRDWIPQPREQLKSALGTSLKLRDALQSLDRVAALLSGGEDVDEFEALLLVFRQQLLRLMEHHEAQWAQLLETQYDQREDD